MDLEVERKLIELFVQKDRRERFTDRIGSPKRRKKIWDDLRDTRYFDRRYFTALRGRDKHIEAIGERLQRLGVGQRIYVMSSDEELDGRELPLREVLRLLWEREEILAFCQASEVGFFKNHEDDFYVLRRSSS